MITMQRLARYVFAEPFRPFRISMADGKSFKICHAEMVSVGRTAARISMFMSDDDQGTYDVSLAQIESVEPLDVTATTDGKQ